MCYINTQLMEQCNEQTVNHIRSLMTDEHIRNLHYPTSEEKANEIILRKIQLLLAMRSNIMRSLGNMERIVHDPEYPLFPYERAMKIRAKISKDPLKE